MILPTALAVAVLASSAQAGKCDALIKKADSVSPSALPAAYSNVIACDLEEATANFTRFMTRASDSEVLVSLSLAAIDGQVWNPVWVMPGKISDYSVRDVISGNIGAACADNTAVVGFLQGAYGALRGLDFQQWDDAFLACESPALDAWIEQTIQSPPSSTYDEKYDQLMGIYVEKRGKDAIVGLEAAAIAAAEGGPFEAILMKMDEAVAPPLGQQLPPDDKAALETALVEIAQQVGPKQARAVAERLVAAGSEDQAAKLLPAVFPDHHRSGVFTWGGLSIERGECKGVKQAVFHVAEISEPGKRWIVNDEVIPALRGFKPKLKKCTPEEGDWPVVTSPQPLMPDGVDAWARKVAGQWMTQGYEVEIKNEASITLD